MGGRPRRRLAGTGHPDPEPLKQFSNEEMLKMASNKSDKSDERPHAW